VADNFSLQALQGAILIIMGAAMFLRADGLYALSRVIEGGESSQTPTWWRLFPFKFLGMALICAGAVGAYKALAP
jgi:hypothetical protein